MRIQTALTRLVGIEHPVVQTGMGWVAGARLVSATANAGGLGILAAATMTIDELATGIAKVKAATDRPFGVNIRADAADAGDRVELMIREGVKVASFALAPKPELIAALKEAGSLVVPSVGAAKHARKVAGWGADAVIVQGGEGGGHTGPVPTTLLLPSVLDALAGTEIPVVAAGGFFDGRGLGPRGCRIRRAVVCRGVWRLGTGGRRCRGLAVGAIRRQVGAVFYPGVAFGGCGRGRGAADGGARGKGGGGAAAERRREGQGVL